MPLSRTILAGGVAGLALLLGASAALAAPAEATASVNVRSGPGTGYGVVDTLYPGEGVDVRRCSGSWCFVVHSGPDGWVSAHYLEAAGGVPVYEPPVYEPPVYDYPPVYAYPPVFGPPVVFPPFQHRPPFEHRRPIHRPPPGSFPPPHHHFPRGGNPPPPPPSTVQQPSLQLQSPNPGGNPRFHRPGDNAPAFHPPTGERNFHRRPDGRKPDLCLVDPSKCGPRH